MVTSSDEEPDLCPADLEELVSLLRCPLDKLPLMIEANSLLEQVALKPGFLKKLMTVLVDPKITPKARERAMAYLKHQIRFLWTSEKKPNRPQAVISETDKQLVRTTLMTYYFEDRGYDRQVTEMVVAMMTSLDFSRHQWSYLPPTLCEIIDKASENSKEEERSYSLAFRFLYRFLLAIDLKKHESQKPDMQRFLRTMQQRMYCIFPENDDAISDGGLFVQKCILKALYAVFMTCIDNEVVKKTELLGWINHLIRVLERTVEIDEYDEFIQELWWSCKKWSVRTITHLYTKHVYCDRPAKSVDLTKFFEENVAERVLDAVKELLQKYSTYEVNDPRLIYHVFVYLSKVVYHDGTWTKLESIMQSICLPAIMRTMLPSAQSVALFNSSPVEFIQREYDVYRFLIEESSPAGDLLRGICRRSNYLQGSYVHAIRRLNEFNMKDDAKTEAALVLLGYIGDVYAELQGSLQLDNDFRNLVIPLMRNEKSPRLRAKACWTVGRYAHARHATQIYSDIQVALADRILHDDSIPVVVEAMIAQDALINDDTLKLGLQTVFVQMFARFIQIIRQTYMEEVVAALRKFLYTFRIDHFGEPKTLASQLVMVYKDLISVAYAGGPDIVWPATSRLLGCLEAIASRTQDLGNGYHEVVIQCVKVAMDIFMNKYALLYEEAFSLVTATLYMDILQCHWAALFFGYRSAMLYEGCIFPMMTPMLRKLVTIDKSWLLAEPERLHLIYQLVMRTLRDPDQNSIAHVYAAKLLECIVIEYSGRLNHCIAYFAEDCLKLQKQCYFDNSAQIMIAVLLIACLTESPQLMYSRFPKWGELVKDGLHYLADFLLASSCDFHGVHDRRMHIAGWIFLWRCPPEYRPKIVVDQSTKIMECIMNVFEGLEKARRRQLIEFKNASCGNFSDSDGFASVEEDFQEAGDESEEKRTKKIGKRRLEDDDKSLLEDKFHFVVDYESDFDEYSLLSGAFTRLATEDRELLAKLSDSSGMAEHQRLIFDKVKKTIAEISGKRKTNQLRKCRSKRCRRHI